MNDNTTQDRLRAIIRNALLPKVPYDEDARVDEALAAINAEIDATRRKAQIYEMVFWFGNGQTKSFDYITREAINKRYEELDAPWLSQPTNLSGDNNV